MKTQANLANAIVEYVDWRTGKILAVDEFYDPGLDETSWYAREQKKRGVWRGPHLAYGCGRPKRPSAPPR